MLDEDWTISWWEQVTDATPTTSWYGFYQTAGPGHSQLRFSKQNSTFIIAYFQHTGSSATNNRSDQMKYPYGLGSGNDRDVWRHFAIQCDIDGGNSGYVKFNWYVDGVIASAFGTSSQINKTTTSGLSSGFNGVPFYLGANYSGVVSANHETGNFAEVSIHQAYLNEDNIVAMYNSGNAGLDLRENSGNYTHASDLVRYYRFTEGTGTTLIDATGNANATIVNGTWDAARHPTIGGTD